MKAKKAMKYDICLANQELPKRGLVLYSWGNVSIVDREENHLIIKPAGVAYEDLNPELMNVVGLGGENLEGENKPSVDTPIHCELYRAFGGICSIVHTHSTYATIWAQAGRAIPVLGTTHADYFNGPIPCARMPIVEEVTHEYEINTAKTIIECFVNRDPEAVPGCLVSGHGVFTWGGDPWTAIHNAVVLEEIAHMAFGTLQLNPEMSSLPEYILNHHFFRKHGPNAYFEVDDMGAGNAG